jgi:hypothetical protein
LFLFVSLCFSLFLFVFVSLLVLRTAGVGVESSGVGRYDLYHAVHISRT